MIVKHTTTRERLNDDDYRSVSIERKGEIPKGYKFEKIVLVMQQMITEKNAHLSNEREVQVA